MGRRVGRKAAAPPPQPPADHPGGPPGPSPDPLAPHHRRMLEASGIAADVIAERGYRTVTSRAELQRLGFAEGQRIVPCLLVPIHGTAGGVVMRQIRPDEPRIVQGRPLKYETPKGAHLCLDVPERIRASLGDPGAPLWITEGAKKVDAAVSRGLCCLGVLGVWGWRGTNAEGGKTALADFEVVALNGRDVLLAFDSDVVTKRQVQAALARLAEFLKHRGARVRYVVLPSGPGGVKTGLDDFLASGRTVDDALGLAQDALPRVEGSDGERLEEYEARGDGLWWNRRAGGAIVPERLCTFTALVVREVLKDDDLETTMHLEIVARAGQVERTFLVDGDAFGSLDWALRHLGVAAIIEPRNGVEKHIRAAIQLLSRDGVVRVTVYAHVGWRRLDGGWAYLHAGGAIGADGLMAEVRVALPENIAAFRLPAPPGGPELIAAVRASLDLLDLGPRRIMVPLLAAVWRALVMEADLFLVIVGRSNVFKTELAALLQQHVGAGFHARNLPAGFGGTGNSLEAIAFTMKDAPLVVDDLAPTGTTSDVARMHGLAERLGRAQGNRAGRTRCAADGALKPEKPPRGLMIWTGEDAPRGHSVKTRGLIVEVRQGDIDVARLTEAQRLAAKGTYALATAGFLRWLAPQRDAVLGGWQDELRALRLSVQGASSYHRVSSNVAELVLGMRLLLRFAREAGVLQQTEHDTLHAEALVACIEAAGRQSARLTSEAPAERFLQLLRAAITSGQAHTDQRDCQEPPENPGMWGWRLERSVSELHGSSTRWIGSGPCVGWVDGPHLYLNLKAAHQAVQRFAQATGEALSVDPDTLKARLHEAGVLHRIERDGHLEVKITVSGTRLRVLHIKTNTLFDAAPEVETADTRAPTHPPAPQPAAAAGSPGPCTRCGAEDAETGFVENGCSACSACWKREQRERGDA